ncbi:MAG: hypothetical protein Q8930_17670, partial [Bacillota bacterium]|nr:hypothetical protein [Bacillota bacterium]
MGARLIIVEGLPGSGKSTTAQLVYDILRDRGINAELYSEGNYNHPADFDGAAYFSSENFDALMRRYPRSEDLLCRIKSRYCGGYVIPYRKAIEEDHISFEKELFEEITRNDIYELLLDIHIDLISSRWKNFTQSRIDEDKVYIFECCFIQNPVTVTMIKANFPKDVTVNYINGLAETIAPLRPVLIYVEQKDIKVSFKRAVQSRPKEWFEGFSNYYLNQGYGYDNGLKGFDGVLKVLEERNSLEGEIYDSLKLIKYRIDNSDFNPEVLSKQVDSIIRQGLQL